VFVFFSLISTVLEHFSNNLLVEILLSFLSKFLYFQVNVFDDYRFERLIALWPVAWQARRLQQYRNTKQSIDDLISELELTPDSDFEGVKIICGDESTFMPTASNMQQLQYCFTQVHSNPLHSAANCITIRDVKFVFSLKINIKIESAIFFKNRIEIDQN